MGDHPARRVDEEPGPGERSPPLGARPARLSGAMRRRHLLDVAAGMVAEAGVEGLTMEGLASRAGVSKGLGYAYFANADDLVVELFEQEMAELDRRVVAAIVSVASLEERVRATVTATFDMVAERGVLLGRLLQRPVGDSPLADHQLRRDEVVERYFGDLFAMEFGLTEVVARSAATVLLAGASASIDLWVRRRMARGDVVELVVRLTMGGLGALAAEPLGGRWSTPRTAEAPEPAPSGG